MGDDQLDITPFQRQVYEAEKRRKAEEKQKRMEQAKSGGGSSRSRNSAYSGGRTRTERVRYKNTGEDTEGNTSFVD